jgi:hypothetical protein
MLLILMRVRLRLLTLIQIWFRTQLPLMIPDPDSQHCLEVLFKSRFSPCFSFDTLKRAFVGVHKVIQANDKSECAQDAVEEILRSTDRN